MQNPGFRNRWGRILEASGCLRAEEFFLRRKRLDTIPFLAAKPRVKYPAQHRVESGDLGGDYVVIGWTVNTVPRLEARLPLNLLNRHILIVGATGTGKSYTASKIAWRVSLKNIPVIILDWHGEYGGLLAEGIRLNPFENPVEFLNPGDPRSDVEVISDVLGLTPPQEYLLWRIISEKGSRIEGVESLARALETYYDDASWVRETRLSLHRKLKILASNPYSRLFSSNSRLLEEVAGAGKPVIVDLSLIGNVSVRRIYGTMLLARLVHRNYGLRKRYLILIEEAQNYLGRENPVGFLARMMGEIRKNNIGFCVITQSPSLIVDQVLVNTNTKIIHSVKSNMDLEVVSRSLFLDQDTARILPYMDVGEALLFNPSLKKPVLIRVE
uniref:ATP-binding protein n=1 Tax=Thermosphaera aggregans TaxID=54254 RepID=A0A7C2FYT9_9CREN